MDALRADAASCQLQTDAFLLARASLPFPRFARKSAACGLRPVTGRFCFAICGAAGHGFRGVRNPGPGARMCRICARSGISRMQDGRCLGVVHGPLNRVAGRRLVSAVGRTPGYTGTKIGVQQRRGRPRGRIARARVDHHCGDAAGLVAFALSDAWRPQQPRIPSRKRSRSSGLICSQRCAKRPRQCIAPRPSIPPKSTRQSNSRPAAWAKSIAGQPKMDGPSQFQRFMTTRLTTTTATIAIARNRNPQRIQFDLIFLTLRLC